MNLQRRLAVLVTVPCAALIGVAGVAWACVPGHDHSAQESMPAALPPAPAEGAAGAAAPASPAPAASTQAATANTAGPAPAVQNTAAPVAPARAAPRTARTTVATAVTPSAPVAAQPGPPAPAVAPSPAAVPAAAPVQTPVTTGAGLYTETVVARTPDADGENGRAGQLVATVLVGGGVLLLLGAVGGALIGWRRSLGPPVAVD